MFRLKLTCTPERPRDFGTQPPASSWACGTDQTVLEARWKHGPFPAVLDPCRPRESRVATVAKLVVEPTLFGGKEVLKEGKWPVRLIYRQIGQLSRVQKAARAFRLESSACS